MHTKESHYVILIEPSVIRRTEYSSVGYSLSLILFIMLRVRVSKENIAIAYQLP